MNYFSLTITRRTLPFMLFCLVLGAQFSQGQEAQTEININNTFHNQLFYNRFLINPTFSLVRENKSYLNILHRNQYASFEDNSQNYYLGFSNKLNENTALGLGIYGQWSGIMQEFGFNANWANSVQLGEKSKLTFGTNVTYLSEGLDKNRIVASENDPAIDDNIRENKIGLHPGITFSTGKFDFGLYAKDFLEYNQTKSELITSFTDRNVKASLQYTQDFDAASGLFKNARLMPLMQLGKNEEGDFSYIGSVLLDMPEYGWLQTSYDETYGLSLGLGFNISQKLSLGYLMEKSLNNEGTNLGWNHELSLAYTFKEDFSTNNGAYFASSDSKDSQIDQIVRNYEEQIAALKNEQKQSTPELKTNSEPQLEANTLAMENRLILDELILRQDSIENARNQMFEKRFETIVRLLRHEVKQKTREERFRDLNEVPYGTATASIDNTIPTLKPALKHNPNPKVPQRKEYKDVPIKVKNRSDIIGVDSGYYIIANVYSNKKYLNAFTNKLKKQGLNARQFYNKENGLYYVYLADFKTKEDAKMAFVSHLDGTYNDEKWIMQVENDITTATAEVVYEN